MEEFSTFAKLCVLLYADDTVLMAETADELQAALDALALYCKQWDLTVNLNILAPKRAGQKKVLARKT